jgi:hypothetical protein
MRLHLIFCAGLVGLAAIAVALAVQAGTLPADALPLPNRLATANVAVVGKITAIENKTETVEPFPGAKNKVTYKIAVVKIGDGLVGPKGMATIRLGFVPTPMNVVINPPPFQPKVDMEGCFFLTKHSVGDFYLAPGGLNFLNKNSPNFDKDLVLLKRCAKILQNPDPALKAKNAEERFLAAAMLLAKYRTRTSPKDTTEPIDAEQSKLILKAIAGADWTPTTDFMKLSPRMVLFKLPLTNKDGWDPPKGSDAKALGAYAQKWLNDHANTYRVEKFVAKKSE